MIYVHRNLDDVEILPGERLFQVSYVSGIPDSDGHYTTQRVWLAAKDQKLAEELAGKWAEGVGEGIEIRSIDEEWILNDPTSMVYSSSSLLFAMDLKGALQREFASNRFITVNQEVHVLGIVDATTMDKMQAFAKGFVEGNNRGKP